MQSAYHFYQNSLQIKFYALQEAQFYINAAIFINEACNSIKKQCWFGKACFPESYVDWHEICYL